MNDWIRRNPFIYFIQFHAAFFFNSFPLIKRQHWCRNAAAAKFNSFSCGWNKSNEAKEKSEKENLGGEWNFGISFIRLEKDWDESKPRPLEANWIAANSIARLPALINSLIHYILNSLISLNYIWFSFSGGGNQTLIRRRKTERCRVQFFPKPPIFTLFLVKLAWFDKRKITEREYYNSTVVDQWIIKLP